MQEINYLLIGKSDVMEKACNKAIQKRIKEIYSRGLDNCELIDPFSFINFFSKGPMKSLPQLKFPHLNKKLIKIFFFKSPVFDKLGADVLLRMIFHHSL